MFIWMFGKWRGAEKVSGLRSLSSIHQAWDRDGRGSAAGQRLSSYSPSHTYRRTHRHTHIHPGGMQHSMPPCIKVWVWMWVCVCVCVCVQIHQMSTFWSPGSKRTWRQRFTQEKKMGAQYVVRAPSSFTAMYCSYSAHTKVKYIVYAGTWWKRFLKNTFQYRIKTLDHIPPSSANIVEWNETLSLAYKALVWLKSD